MKKSCCPSSVMVPKGFIPFLLYSSFALVAPLMYIYDHSIDYTDDMTRATIITLSGLYAFTVVVANDPAVWFNMVLFFHIALESKVADMLIDKARDDATSDSDTVLSWIGACTVIVHLVPFLLTDITWLLTFLAAVGVVVNTAALVFLDGIPLLLLTGLSSVSLLGTTISVRGVCDISTSFLMQLKRAANEGRWLKCSTMQM